MGDAMAVVPLHATGWAICAAVLLALFVHADALPFADESEVVPESDALSPWHEDGETIHGQPGLHKLIAKKEQEETQAREAKWQEEGLLVKSVLGPLKTVKMLQ